MFYLLMISFMLMMISIIIVLMNLIFSKKMIKIRNKLTPFECGFEPMSKLRLPFSIQFYLISIIFLIFDVEISLIFPVMEMFENKFKLYMNMYMYVLIMLIIGLYYEWKNGSLKWM
uniref:NADH-ubiquinone oxidoreductase chain 3 n=1 Tax=Oberthuerella sharkeyi TaxID=2943459 RepID=A0A9E8GDS8_9HYME|nr:NADH dehydrogenase subunit 3 [Oberthuerella sharkeyi]